MKKVCIIGCGAIGSLYAAHLARVAEVWAFVRREDHAAALNKEGLRVTGTHDFSVNLKATANPAEICPTAIFGIIATKATQVEESIRPSASRFDKGCHPLGAERTWQRRDHCRSHQGLRPSRHHFHERHPPQRHPRAVRTRHRHLARTLRTKRHSLFGC